VDNLSPRASLAWYTLRCLIAKVLGFIDQHMQRVSEQGMFTLPEHLIPRTNRASALNSVSFSDEWYTFTVANLEGGLIFITV
jgi:hypothetical protein